MNLVDIEVEIKRYRPQAGDVLLVKPSRPLNQHEQQIAGGFLADVFGDSGVRVILAEPGTTIEVLRAEGSS